MQTSKIIIIKVLSVHSRLVFGLVMESSNLQDRHLISLGHTKQLLTIHRQSTRFTSSVGTTTVHKQRCILEERQLLPTSLSLLQDAALPLTKPVVILNSPLTVGHGRGHLQETLSLVGIRLGLCVTRTCRRAAIDAMHVPKDHHVLELTLQTLGCKNQLLHARKTPLRFFERPWLIQKFSLVRTIFEERIVTDGRSLLRVTYPEGILASPGRPLNTFLLQMLPASIIDLTHHLPPNHTDLVKDKETNILHTFPTLQECITLLDLKETVNADGKRSMNRRSTLSHLKSGAASGRSLQTDLLSLERRHPTAMGVLSDLRDGTHRPRLPRTSDARHEHAHGLTTLPSSTTACHNVRRKGLPSI